MSGHTQGIVLLTVILTLLVEFAIVGVVAICLAVSDA